MRFALVFLFVCSLARADALGDLKTTLAGITARAPVRATVSFKHSRNNGDDAKKSVPGEVRAIVEDAADGLHITWPRAVIDAATAEENARAKDRNAPASTRRTMGELNATVLSDYLNAGGQILRVLATAELVEDVAAPWQGQPARRLTVKITPPLSEKDKKYIKEVSVVGKIWLGADGWPLAAEQTMDMKGRALLVINFAQHEQQEFHYARVGDRLVTILHRKDSDSSGAGEHGSEHALTTLVLEKS